MAPDHDQDAISLDSFHEQQSSPAHAETTEDDGLENGIYENQALLESTDALGDAYECLPARESGDTYHRQNIPWSGNSSSARNLKTCLRCIIGPARPRVFQINPFFPRVQNAPTRLVDRWLPGTRSKCIVLTIFYCFWIVCFVVLLRQSISSPTIEGFDPPVRLSCTSGLWRSRAGCGLDGANCLPFDNSSFAFRCPASCKDVQVLEPYGVGADEVIYTSLVIGGQAPGKDYPIYRSDSFICAAALHAGIFSDDTGGSGLVTRVGEQADYPSIDANGISSIPFPSYFPSSFTFGELKENKASQHRDLRWPLLVVSVIFTSILSIFTTSSAVLFFSIFTGLFFHVALVSDPPNFADFSEVVSVALERFLPASFISVVIYYFCVRRSLRGLNAQLEKTILWLGGCWVGALNNYTFDRIPLSRLTPHDLKQQPGAITSLIILVGSILAIALGQAWALWREGRLPKYLKLYALMAAPLLVLVAIPNMNLRIHHYILALLLLPGTSLQTRPSLLYQGILLGLFINGIARWGFDSILQTSAQLLNDGQMGSALPVIAFPETAPDSIRFNLSEWADNNDEANGISVLINDVERIRLWKNDGADSFSWNRQRDGYPEFFRFGYLFQETLGGFWYGDFTKAGTWGQNGTWIHMASGPGR